MNLLAFLLFISLFFCSPALAQDSLVKTKAIDALKEQIKNEIKNFQPRPELSRKQNDLFKEKYTRKVEQELKLLDPKLAILEGDLYNKVNGIFLKILAANPSIPQDTKLVLYRSNVFNAFTMGDNVIFIHLGFLYSLANEDEIALVIGHEIAHNSLKHIDHSILQAVLFETNDSLKSEIKSISKQEYGVVSALNEIMMPRIMESREVSRKHEFESDSLGLLYMKRAGYDVSKAVAMFQAMEMHTEKLSEGLDFHACLGLADFPEIAKKEQDYSRGGSLGVFEEDDELRSYLATHPYDRDRFLKLVRIEGLDTGFSRYERPLDELYLNDYRQISKEVMNTSWQHQNLTEVLYYACKHVAGFPEDEDGYRMLSAALLSTGFLKERRRAGKHLMTQSPHLLEDLDRTCALVSRLSPGDCYALAQKAQQRFSSSPSSGSLHALYTLMGFMRSEKYDLFEALWLTEKKQIQESNYAWVLREMEMYLYNSKQLKFLKPHK